MKETRKLISRSFSLPSINHKNNLRFNQFLHLLQIIEKASNVILDKLRADEVNSDIYDQFQYRPDIIGSQRYFIEPYKTTWGPQVCLMY
jgi:hypothetical protein